MSDRLNKILKVGLEKKKASDPDYLKTTRTLYNNYDEGFVTNFVVNHVLKGIKRNVKKT
tara:strand:+ start:7226 stop:7402 length:177 start_codon:yes stop_codon:yes gene_type:complete